MYRTPGLITLYTYVKNRQAAEQEKKNLFKVFTYTEFCNQRVVVPWQLPY
jgi:hypothetical protein